MFGKKESPWWNNISTEEVKETRADIIISSWTAMLQTLEDKFGQDISQWQWKNTLSVEHEHPLGMVWPLNLLFNVGPFEAAGGNETINNMMFRISQDDFKATWGPSTRRIIDFGNIEQSWGINPTGQSGVILDKHYDDQAKMHSKGEFRPQYTLKSEILAHKEGLLELLPE